MAADRQHLEIWPERDMTDLLDQLHETPAIPLTQPTSLGPGPGVEPPPGLKEPRLGMPELAGSSLLAWCRDHAISLVTVAGLMLLTGLVIGAGITHYPSFGDDEGTYVSEAWALLTHGQLSHYTYWYDHPPGGWIQLALLTWIFGPLVKGASAVATARSLMVLPAMATAGLLYALARRLRLRRVFAVAAVLLLIFSPLGLASMRQVYLENFALPWVLAAFVLAASPSRRLWAFAASGACFAVGILSKETMLLFLPGLVMAVIHNADRRTRAFCLTAFFSSFVLIGASYPLYALLKGELLPGPGHVSLAQAIVWQLSGRVGSGSVFATHSAARQVLDAWLRIDPWLLALGVGSLPVALFMRRLRPFAVAVMVALAVGFDGGYLPAPFEIGLLPFCALLFAGLLDSLWGWSGALGRRRWRRLGPAATAMTVLVLASLMGPAWNSGDSYAMSADASQPELSAEHWIESHVSRRARLLIDDTMYVDLVRAGFQPRYGVVWFYKLGFTNNLDPAIVRRLPRGWREFDYVVSTPVIRGAIAQDPAGYRQVRAALTHSRTVAAFGSSPGARVEVRRLVGNGVGSGRIPVRRT
jgi:hypothetical protein